MNPFGDMSAEAVKLFALAGWDPSRHVDIAKSRKVLEREGYQANPFAVAILESVSGLCVDFPAAGINPYDHQYVFDPLDAGSGEFDRVVDWQATLGMTFFPLGWEPSSSTCLWAAIDGAIYSGFEYGLYFLGKSFGAAMNHLTFFPTRMVCVIECP